MLLSAIFGLAAAIAGAIIYYAVIAITGWEIGLVAILIGYMVGYGVLFGSGGRGGRKYQLLAAGLTYFSVGLAYIIPAFSSMVTKGISGIVSGLMMSLSLPVIVTLRSFPSGLITACIVGFAIYQAWIMTASRGVVVSESKEFGDVLETPAATPQISAPQEIPAPSPLAAGNDKTGWKKGAAIAGAIALFAFTKFKFLLLGLTKIKTFVSMFAFFGVYWATFGWPLALGLVISIYIHEMGHVAALRKYGIGAGAPLFIPGVGALILMKQHIDDPKVDAEIGLAGPIYGLAAGILAYVVYLITGTQIWAAIAQLTGFINLFNLIPIWQLDGSRGFHALSRQQRWIIVGALGLAYLISNKGLLLIIGAVAIYKAYKSPTFAVPHAKTLNTFIVLIAALTALASIPVIK